MIVGEVIQVLDPKKKYKVRIENSPGLLQDTRAQLRTAYSDTFQKYVDVKIEFENENIYGQIANLESEIRELEKEGTLSSSHQVLYKMTEIRNLQAKASQYINTMRDIDAILKNYEVRMARFGREPDYYDFDIYSSTYRELFEGDKVNVIFHSYDTTTAVIAPEYETEGFGNWLVGTFTQSPNEWFRNTVLEPYLARTNIKYKKAIINGYDEEKDTFSVSTYEVENVFNVNILKTKRNLMAYSDRYNVCRWRYKEGAERPYFIGDDVLVKIPEGEDVIPEIIGFWQEPRRPFRFTGISNFYKQGYKLEGGMIPDDTFKTNLSLSSVYDSGQQADIYSRLSGYSSIHNHNDVTLMMGYLLSEQYRAGDYNVISQFMPVQNGLTDFDGKQKNIGSVNDNRNTRNNDSHVLNKGFMRDFDSPLLCNGINYEKYIYVGDGTGTSRPRIVFNPQNRYFRNYVYQINGEYAYLRTGYAVIPDDLRTVYINFNDGNGSQKRSWDSTEVQQTYLEICQYNQNLIDNLDIADRDKVYLYDNENGQHFNDFKSFYDAMLERRVFFDKPKWVSFDERRVRVKDLPKITGLYDATNSRADSGSFPNFQNDRIFFTGNYSFKDYPSQDKDVVSQIAADCDPDKHLNERVYVNQLLPAGTLPNQPNPAIVRSDNSRFEIKREYQDWGYRNAYVDVYYRIHEFEYEEIEFTD